MKFNKMLSVLEGVEEKGTLYLCLRITEELSTRKELLPLLQRGKGLVALLIFYMDRKKWNEIAPFSTFTYFEIFKKL